MLQKPERADTYEYGEHDAEDKEEQRGPGQPTILQVEGDSGEETSHQADRWWPLPSCEVTHNGAEPDEEAHDEREDRRGEAQNDLIILEASSGNDHR